MKNKRWTPPTSPLPPARKPYTGPANIIASPDEDKHRFMLYLFEETERMRLRSITNGLLDDIEYLLRALHPELYAMACLLKDTGKVVMPPSSPSGWPFKKPFYEIPITLGEIAAVDEKLAQAIRDRLVHLLWSNNNASKLF